MGVRSMSESAPTLMGWERAALAVEKVRDRLRRTSLALGQAGVAYAIIGGNAVAEWVGRVEEAAVRTTRNVDILIRRTDLDAAKSAMEGAGFVYRNVLGLDVVIDGPNGRAMDAVHVLFAGEKIRQDHLTVASDVTDSVPAAQFQVIALGALVQMKLNSNRDKDRTHLRDMIGVGIIDRSWLPNLPPPLATRLQKLLDTPDG